MGTIKRGHWGKEQAQGDLELKGKKKKSPRRDVSIQRQKVRTWVTDCNGKDRPARVKAAPYTAGRGDQELKGKKKNPPGGTSAHRDRKQELRSLTAMARTGLQE